MMADDDDDHDDVTCETRTTAAATAASILPLIRKRLARISCCNYYLNSMKIITVAFIKSKVLA